MTSRTSLSPEEAEALWKEARDLWATHKKRKCKKAIKLVW